MGRAACRNYFFAEAVRSYAAGLPEEEKVRLKGLNDQYVGRVLAALHDRLCEDWTVDALADEAGLSRSAFVERFTEAMGLPPMKYITQSRLQLAKQLLLDGCHAVAQVAASVGYEAEEAFNRAFKREFGLPPPNGAICSNSGRRPNPHPVFPLSRPKVLRTGEGENDAERP